MAEAYAVPKRPVQATVTMADGEPAPVVLFLADRAETHEGSERPSDLLARSGAFLPILDRDGALALIGRDRISILSLPIEEDPPPALATSCRVQIRVSGGTSIEGTVHYMMPEANRRLQDFLNLPEPFVAVRQTETVIFINKGRIIEVRTPTR